MGRNGSQVEIALQAEPLSITGIDTDSVRDSKMSQIKNQHRQIFRSAVLAELCVKSILCDIDRLLIVIAPWFSVTG